MYILPFKKVQRLAPLLFVGLLVGCLAKPNRYSGSSLNDKEIRPDPPKEIKTKIEGGTIVVTWETVKHASSYNLYWSDQQDLDKKTANKVDRFLIPRFRHQAIDKKTTYSYAVSAVGSGGEGELSKIVVVDPEPIDPVEARSDQNRLRNVTISGDGKRMAFVKDSCRESLRCIFFAEKNDRGWGEPAEGLAFKIDIKRSGPHLKLSQDGQRLLYTNDEGVFHAVLNNGIWESKQLSAKGDSSRINANRDWTRIAWIFEEYVYVADLTASQTLANIKKVTKATNFDLNETGDVIVIERAGVRSLNYVAQEWQEKNMGAGRLPKVSADGGTMAAFTDDRFLVVYRREGTLWKTTQQKIKGCCTQHASVAPDGSTIVTGQIILAYEGNGWNGLVDLKMNTYEAVFNESQSSIIFLTENEIYEINRTGEYWNKPKRLY